MGSETAAIGTHLGGNDIAHLPRGPPRAISATDCPCIHQHRPLPPVRPRSVPHAGATSQRDDTLDRRSRRHVTPRNRMTARASAATPTRRILIAHRLCRSRVARDYVDSRCNTLARDQPRRHSYAAATSLMQQPSAQPLLRYRRPRMRERNTMRLRGSRSDIRDARGIVRRTSTPQPRWPATATDR